MADSNDRSSADVQASSDTATVRAERDEGAIVGLLDEEEPTTSDTPPAIQNGAVSNRYREILREQADDISDEGSVDALPKRVGSPIDSLLSVPDDSPSIQASVSQKPHDAQANLGSRVP